MSEPSVSPRLLSPPFPISAAHQAFVLPCGRRVRYCGAVPPRKKTRTCLINFCLCIPRQCGVSVAVDATWKTQKRLAVLGFLSTCMRSCSSDAKTSRDRGSFPCPSYAGSCTRGSRLCSSASVQLVFLEGTCKKSSSLMCHRKLDLS